ncbi:lysylphosphatidylglycerol synthase transmembrane domain-containing protein [Streptomyces dubilierae]|uniref:lysylphosphatidylglycerol synthase transmembrane domain-containing protein n=1 Tax=Streptomyces dubilierae TaxID=3075533 RepID=UPI00374E0437
MIPATSAASGPTHRRPADRAGAPAAAATPVPAAPGIGDRDSESGVVAGLPGVPSPTAGTETPGDRTGAPAPGRPRPLLARLGSRKARTRLGTVVGVAIVGVLFWRLGTGAFLDGLRRIDAVTLLLALGIGAVTTVFSAWRWALVARGLRIRLPFGPAVADYYRALFLNAALPGGVLGDVHRAVRHGRSEGDLRRGVKAVVLERTAGQLALFAAAAVVLLTMPSPVLAEARHLAPLAALAGLGALAVVLALRMNRATPARRGGRVRALLAEAREGLLSRRNGPGVLASSVVVLAGYVAMFVLAARVAGTTASVAVLVPLAVLALLAMGLPLNVGGWGPREGVTAWAFGAAGLGAGRGLAVAVVYGVLSLVASLPGLIVLVARWYTGLRAADGARATDGAGATDRTGAADRTRAAGADPGAGPAPRTTYASEVSIEKYAPKVSARLARSSFPFSADPSEGRPMTPESV